MNKRGLSEVIYIMAAIILTLVSLSLIFVGYVNRSIDLSPDLSCNEFRISNPVRIISSCLDSENKRFEVNLKRQIGDEEFTELKFNILNSEGKKQWVCGGASCGQCIIIQEGDTKTFYLEYQEEISSSQKITLELDGCIVGEQNITECN